MSPHISARSPADSNLAPSEPHSVSQGCGGCCCCSFVESINFLGEMNHDDAESQPTKANRSKIDNDSHIFQLLRAETGTETKTATNTHGRNRSRFDLSICSEQNTRGNYVPQGKRSKNHNSIGYGLWMIAHLGFYYGLRTGNTDGRGP